MCYNADMKRLFALLAIVALFMTNMADVAHAGCSDAAGDQEISMNADDHHNTDSDVNCDCCTSCHVHHTHAFFSQSKPEHAPEMMTAFNSREDTSFLSQLHYPPSKPPKA